MSSMPIANLQQVVERLRYNAPAVQLALSKQRTLIDTQGSMQLRQESASLLEELPSMLFMSVYVKCSVRLLQYDVIMKF